MTFSLNEKEDEARRAWYAVHKDHCAKTLDPETGQTREHEIGGEAWPSIRYIFTPTGIGDGIVIECSCGRSIDVTDLDSW